MKILTISAITTAVTIGLFATAAHANWFGSDHGAIKTQDQKFSYTMGYGLGKNAKINDIHINAALVSQGINDALDGKKSALTPKEMQEVTHAVQKQVIAKALSEQEKLAQTNQTASAQYLSKIAKESGIKTIEPGLYYKVIKQGTGPIPSKNDTVTVNYQGTLTDGTVFDSSYQRGEPATFKLNQVIPGWTKALATMPQGSTWMVYIAPKLAYGKFAPPAIGPNQALTFKIDLISVKSDSTQVEPKANS